VPNALALPLMFAVSRDAQRTFENRKRKGKFSPKFPDSIKAVLKIGIRENWLENFPGRAISPKMPNIPKTEV
jgi:hypothetical protein